MKVFNAIFIAMILTYGLSLIVADSSHCPKKCHCYNKTVNCDAHKKSRDKLRDIPPDIPADTVILSFRYNVIKILKRNSFQNLHQLKYLSLAHCRINRKIEDGAFNGLTNLETLDLSANQLHYLSRSSGKTFQGLSSLKVLHLNSTSLFKVPSIALSPLNTLQSLSLSGNVLTSALYFDDVFLNFTHLKHLDLSSNSIQVLNDSCFVNLKNSPIKVLDFSDSQIRNISAKAFFPFSKLERLVLSGNKLKMGIRLALVSLCQSNLSTLVLQSMDITNISHAFSCFSNLTNLDLARNKITLLENHGFNYTNKIKHLWLNSNVPLSTVGNEAFYGLWLLESLVMTDCRLPLFPEFDGKKGHGPRVVFMPRLKKLCLDSNLQLGKVSKNSFRGLEKVEFLSFAINSIRSGINEDTFTYLKSVKYLYFDKNAITSVDGSAFRPLSNVEQLDISNNNIEFKRKECYFAGLSTLISLKMANVDMGKLSFFDKVCLFEGLTELKYLDLHKVSLKKLPANIFADLKSLVYLRISSNRLLAINPAVFSSMLSLKRLDVSSNKIQNINQSSLQPFLDKGLNHFEAYDNPYACTCDLRWYTDWLRQMKRTKKVKIIIRKNMQYKCASPKKFKNKQLRTYNPTFIDCYETPFIIGTTVGSFAVLVTIVVTVGYHYRWYIRYWLFLFRSRFAKNLARKDERLVYQYDCFVTYCEDDGWVLETLRPKLEDEFGFRVCLQDRDFELGKSKVENIDEAIHNSRKILIVLTTNFAKNSWCNFEVSLAHANCLENDIKAQQHLIIIMMEDVSPKYMTPILRYLVRKRTYIEWTGDEVGQNLFWQKLPDAIRSTPCNLC